MQFFKKRSARSGWIVPGILVVSGCFSYVPADMGTVPEGNDVRLYLTRQGVAGLPEIPTQSGPRLTGTLVRKDNDQILLRVPVAVQQDGLMTRTLGQDVRIPASDIVQLERRSFNRARTGFAVAGGAVAVVGLIAAFVKSQPQNVDPRPGDEEGPGVHGRWFQLVTFPVR
jgi:hypothetical protein